MRTAVWPGNRPAAVLVFREVPPTGFPASGGLEWGFGREKERKEEGNGKERNIGRKLKGLCAWLCAFLMAFTVLAGAVPVEVLAADYGLDYEIADGTIM